MAVGNDGNLGTLGETWLGSARGAAAPGHLGRHGHRRGLRAEGATVAGRPRVGRRNRPHRHADRRPEVRLRKPRLLRGPGQPQAIERDIREALGRRPNQRADGTYRRRPERHPQRLDPPRAGGRGRPGHRGRPPRRRSPRLRLPDRPPPDRPGGHCPGRRASSRRAAIS